MQHSFPPAQHCRHRRKQIGDGGGITVLNRHGNRPAHPVDLETIKISRVVLDMFGGPQEEDIVNMDGLVQKRPLTGQHQQADE